MPQRSCFITAFWPSGFLNGGSNSWSVYRFAPKGYGRTLFPQEFDPAGISVDQFHLGNNQPRIAATAGDDPRDDQLYAGIHSFDGNNVIDYVQLRDPQYDRRSERGHG